MRRALGDPFLCGDHNGRGFHLPVTFQVQEATSPNSTLKSDPATLQTTIALKMAQIRRSNYEVPEFMVRKLDGRVLPILNGTPASGVAYRGIQPMGFGGRGTTREDCTSIISRTIPFVYILTGIFKTGISLKSIAPALRHRMLSSPPQTSSAPSGGSQGSIGPASILGKMSSCQY